MLVAAALVAMAMAACGGGSTKAQGAPPHSAPATSRSSAATSAGDAVTAALSATGCDGAGGQGDSTLSLVFGRVTRTVIVHLPTAYTSTEAEPLVLNMHGSGSTAAAQEAFTGMDTTADANNFIVVYPQAAIPAGSGFDWNVPGQPLVGGGAVPPSAPNDVAFLQQLVTVLSQRYCIDPSRVYATGFSGGARMASQLGCDAAGVFAAVAPVSGLRLPSPCPSTRAEPVLSFHGTADPVDPYNGQGQKYWTYSVPTAAEAWAAHDSCGPASAVSQPAAGTTLTSYTGCSDDAAVDLYTISGEGHEWPGGPKLSTALQKELGPQSSAINADAIIWAFFEAHSLP